MQSHHRRLCSKLPIKTWFDVGFERYLQEERIVRRPPATPPTAYRSCRSQPSLLKDAYGARVPLQQQQQQQRCESTWFQFLCEQHLLDESLLDEESQVDEEGSEGARMSAANALGAILALSYY